MGQLGGRLMYFAVKAGAEFAAIVAFVAMLLVVTGAW